MVILQRIVLLAFLCSFPANHAIAEHKTISPIRLKSPNQALFDAAFAGSVKGIQRALAAGANVNALDRKYGRTALMHAVASGNNEAVKALICAGADVNAVVWIGRNVINSFPSLTRMSGALPLSVLGVAARVGACPEIVNTLIQAGAIIDYRGFFI